MLNTGIHHATLERANDGTWSISVAGVRAACCDPCRASIVSNLSFPRRTAGFDRQGTRFTIQHIHSPLPLPIGPCESRSRRPQSFATRHRQPARLRILVLCSSLKHQCPETCHLLSLKRCTIRSFVESRNPEANSVAVVSSQVDPSFLATPGFRVQIAARVDVALILLASMAIDARCVSRLAACFSAAELRLQHP
jgi:hypothetical protein